jgi:hypothetical protein
MNKNETRRSVDPSNRKSILRTLGIILGCLKFHRIEGSLSIFNRRAEKTLRKNEPKKP